METLPEYTSLPDPEATIFVVDDDVSVRQSLERLIRKEGWRAEFFASAHAFLDHPHVSGPGCLLLEVTLPDLNGLDVQKITSSNQPHIPIIFITGYADISMTVRAMKAGAFDFLTKPFAPQLLIDTIERAIDRSKSAVRSTAETRALRERYSSLTLREREVISLVVSGLSNKQIAEELGISEITVKAHRASAKGKLKAESIAELVKMDARLSPA
jgi:RNA polymerase sigma factor (sigma-70 family)